MPSPPEIAATSLVSIGYSPPPLAVTYTVHAVIMGLAWLLLAPLGAPPVPPSHRAAARGPSSPPPLAGALCSPSTRPILREAPTPPPFGFLRRSAGALIARYRESGCAQVTPSTPTAAPGAAPGGKPSWLRAHTALLGGATALTVAGAVVSFVMVKGAHMEHVRRSETVSALSEYGSKGSGRAYRPQSAA